MNAKNLWICEFENCRKYANYGKYYFKPLRCNEHKGEYKLVSKICIHPNCKVRPSYNVEWETKALYCATHKLDGMVDVKNETCIHPNCKVQPSYNVEGETKALYCATHKLDGMVNVKHNKCLGNFCLGTRANSKYKGYCSSCYQHLFPNDPLTLQIRSKTKEILL